jgi:hypothetical protein
VVIDKATAAVEFDSAVTVVNLEVEGLCAKIAGSSFGQVEELGANSLPAVRGFDEEFIDPGTFAAVFEAEIEANDEVGNWSLLVARQVDNTVMGILEELREIFLDDEVVEGLLPGIIVLHMAHEQEQRIDVGGTGRQNRNGHEKRHNLSEGGKNGSNSHFKRNESGTTKKQLYQVGLHQVLQPAG